MHEKIKVGLRTMGALMVLMFSANTFAAAGKILLTRGDVTVNGQAAVLQGQVEKGDIIKAGSDGSATVVMTDNSVLNIVANSEIAIEDFVYSAAAPSSNKADINIVKGTLRYVSGGIAKADPDKVSLRAGTATIGIRGTAIEASFDGISVSVNTGLGLATITMPGRSPMTVAVGNAGTANTQTGETSVAPAPAPAFVQAAVAAIQSTVESDTGQSALGDAVAGDQQGGNDLAVLVVATMSANATELGADASNVNQAIQSIAQAAPELAAAMVFVASAIDPGNANSFAATARAAAPDQADAIDAAEVAAEDTTIVDDGGDTTGGDDTAGDDDPAGDDSGDGDSGDAGDGDSGDSGDSGDTAPPATDTPPPPPPPSSGDPGNTNDPNAGG